MSMRLEKGWGAWGLDYRPDFNVVKRPRWIVNWKKNLWASQRLWNKSLGCRRKLVSLVVDVDGIDVSNDEAILKNGRAIGYVSSGGYAHHAQKSMAMGYVEIAHSAPTDQLDIEILGKLINEVLGAPIYDQIAIRCAAKS